MDPLPNGVTVRVGDVPSDSVEFWVPPFLQDAPDRAVTRGLRDLRVVQLLTAGFEVWLGRLPDGVTLCNARGVHSSATSEWTVAAILAYLHDFPFFVRAQASGQWRYRRTDELRGKRVLVIGRGRDWRGHRRSAVSVRGRAGTGRPPSPRRSPQRGRAAATAAGRGHRGPDCAADRRDDSHASTGTSSPRCAMVPSSSTPPGVRWWTRRR